MDIKVNGIDLFYTKSGDGHPLILLHGNSETHAIFDKVIEKLSTHYTVYAIDSRCHGKSSETASVTYQLMADDVVAFITKLQLQTPFLYGFSDGGIVGLLIATQHPRLLGKLAVSGATSSVEGMKKKWVFMFRLSYFFKRDKLFKMVLTQPKIEAEKLEQIAVPTLLLFGDKDIPTKEDIEYMSRTVPGSELRILENESHMSYVVHSTKLYPILHDFFQ